MVAINTEIVEGIEAEHENIKREYKAEIRAKAREVLEKFVKVEVKIKEL